MAFGPFGGFSRWSVHRLSQSRSGLIHISIGSGPIFPDGAQFFCSIVPSPGAGGGAGCQGTDQDAAERCHSRHSCLWHLPLMWLVALLMPTILMALFWQGGLLSVKGGRCLFRPGWGMDAPTHFCWARLAVRSPVGANPLPTLEGRVKTQIPCTL